MLPQTQQNKLSVVETTPILKLHFLNYQINSECLTFLTQEQDTSTIIAGRTVSFVIPTLSGHIGTIPF